MTRNDDKELILRFFIVLHIFSVGLYVLPICCAGSTEVVNRVIHGFYHCLFLFGLVDLICILILNSFFAAITIP